LDVNSAKRELLVENQAAANNAGQYYVYDVIPEFSPAAILLWTKVLTIIGLTAIKRRHKTDLRLECGEVP